MNHFCNKKSFCTFLLILSMVVFVAMDLPSQYFYIEEEEQVQEKKPDKTIDEKVGTEQKQEIPPTEARNIKAEHFADMKGVVKITWKVSPDYFDEFLVARSTEVIDTKIKALKADTVQILQSSATNEVLDFVSASGSFYYVILSRKKIKDGDVRLFKDDNFTSLPVVIHPDDVYYHVKEIDAKSYDLQKVTIHWQKLSKSGLLYTLYRGTRRLDTTEKIKNAQKVTEVSDKGDFIDDTIDIPGVYYYAVTAREEKGVERVYPYPGHNYTMSGVSIKSKDVDQNAIYRIRSIEASSHQKGVKVKWTYTGSVGGKFYRIFRSPSFINNSKEIVEDMFIGDVDISKKNFTDPIPPAGTFYYGILPYGYSEENTPLLRGVNITNYTVKVEGEKMPVIKEDKVAQKKKTEPKIVFTPEYTGGSIDLILHKTFFKGKYAQCVKELKNAIPATDNEIEKAKASMFIGRSYIELGQYNKALDYLILEDVQKNFPDESRFWQENALRKLK